VLSKFCNYKYDHTKSHKINLYVKMHVHRVREKRGHSILGITLTYLRHSFVSSWYLSVENLAQHSALPHRYVEMTSDIIKNAVYRQRGTFNKSFSKGKNMTLQLNCWKNVQTETGVIID